jgi:hypothetical protein
MNYQTDVMTKKRADAFEKLIGVLIGTETQLNEHDDDEFSVDVFELELSKEVEICRRCESICKLADL